MSTEVTAFAYFLLCFALLYLSPTVFINARQLQLHQRNELHVRFNDAVTKLVTERVTSSMR